MRQEIVKAFESGFSKLKKEVESFDNYADFWSVRDGVTNSPGNLTLHLMGNLNHYIGAKLGASGYVRDRPAEFASGPQSRTDMLDKIENTRSVVIRSLEGLSDAALAADFPADEGDEIRNVAAELTHILFHFGYHLGQINYYRRLLAT